MDTDRLPSLVSDLYQIVDELEEMFPGRHFTPDGHLVGSLGEALVAYHYGLDLLTASEKGRDAVKDGVSIEIKATQGSRVAFRHEPEHAIVIKIHTDGTFSEIYNGPGDLVWAQFKERNLPSNGQYQIAISRLKSLQKSVPDALRIPPVEICLTKC